MHTSLADKTASSDDAICAKSTSLHGAEGAFPSQEMTDAQFKQFMLIENNEIPLSSVNFRKKLRTVVSVL